MHHKISIPSFLGGSLVVSNVSLLPSVHIFVAVLVSEAESFKGICPAEESLDHGGRRLSALLDAELLPKARLPTDFHPTV